MVHAVYAMENKPEHRNLLDVCIEELKSFSFSILKKYSVELPDSTLKSTCEGDVWGAQIWNYDPGYAHSLFVRTSSDNELVIEILSKCENKGLILINDDKFDNIFNDGSIDRIKVRISTFIMEAVNEISKQKTSG